jgi:hypothetical protein
MNRNLPNRPDNALNEKNLLRYILEEAGAPKMRNTFKRHNIQPGKFDVFQSFIIVLIDTVYDTYLGNDCIYREADIVNHFRWCFQKTCSELKDKGFRFEENQVLHDYFLEYFRINLYLCESARETDFAYFRSFFHMDPKQSMKHADLDSMVDLYEVFDKSLLRGRNLVTSR